MAEQYHDFRRYGLSGDHVSVLLRLPMAHRPTVYAGLTGDDGDGCPVVCSAPGCGTVLPLRAAHGGRIEHNYTAGILPASRCAHPLADSGQHFACSLDHLRAALIACWDSHLRPAVDANMTALATWQARQALPAPHQEAPHDPA